MRRPSQAADSVDALLHGVTVSDDVAAERPVAMTKRFAVLPGLCLCLCCAPIWAEGVCELQHRISVGGDRCKA
jgi:hypothetical protein